MTRKINTRSRFYVTTAIVLVVIGGLLILTRTSNSKLIADFYQKSRAELAAIHAPRQGDTSLLPSGEWYAIRLEHSCCSGFGFDAVMIRDSEGKYYTAEKNYCGYEGFLGTLGRGSITNLQDLRTRLHEKGFRSE